MWHELDQEAIARAEHAGSPPRSQQETEALVVMVRLALYNQNQPCGAVALRRRLQDHYCLRPLPSLHRIRKILVQYGLTHKRTGWYEGEEPFWLPASSCIPQEKRRYY